MSGVEIEIEIEIGIGIGIGIGIEIEIEIGFGFGFGIGIGCRVSGVRGKKGSGFRTWQLSIVICQLSFGNWLQGLMVRRGSCFFFSQ